MAHLDAHPECSLCFHNVQWRHEDGSRPPVPYNSADQALEVGLHDIIGANPVAACSALFRRAAIDPLPAWFFEQRWGDWQLCLMAAMHGRIHYQPEVMAVHLTHPGGVFSRLSRAEALEGISECQEGMRGISRPGWRGAGARRWGDLVPARNRARAPGRSGRGAPLAA